MNKYSDMKRPLSSKCLNRKGILSHSNSRKIVYERKVSNHYSYSNLEDPEFSKFMPVQKSGIVSDLARIENEKALKKSSSMVNRLKKSDLVSEKAMNLKRPSERDFNHLMNKLDSVISNRNTNKKLLLYERISLEVELDEGNSQYFKVLVKNQKSPLKVIIDKDFGMVESFLSKTTNEPKETDHDEKYKTDVFQFSDSHSTFHYEYLHLGISALAYTKFTITVRFGKEKRSTLTTIEKVNTEAHNKLRKQLNLSTKNFIQQNKHPLPTSEVLSQHKRKFSDWSQRRKEVLLRKRTFMKEKKDRAISMLNRYAQKHEEEKKERELKQSRVILEHRQKIWLVLINAVLMIETLGNARKQIRQEKLEYFTKNNSARKIQEAYRKQLPSDLNLSRSSNILKLFLFANSITHKRNAVKFIRDSSKNACLSETFSEYVNKIVKIQRTWRHVLEETKKKYQELVTCWNKAIGQIVLDGKVKNKKKMPDMTEYIMIGVTHRNAILKPYFQLKKHEFMVNLRIYLDSANCVKRKLISKISANYKDVYAKGLPIFEYKPSKEEIIDLIEQARILSRSQFN